MNVTTLVSSRLCFINSREDSDGRDRGWLPEHSLAEINVPLYFANYHQLVTAYQVGAATQASRSRDDHRVEGRSG